jgi:hypothetical protein
MSKVKGTDIVILRSILKERGKLIEDQFMARLSPELTQLYGNVLATTWVPIQEIEKLYENAAEVFFPSETDKISHLARMLAEKSFGGIYKAFLRNPTPKSVIEKASIIWNAYHVKGKLGVSVISDHGATLLVSDYPELSPIIRKVFNGQLAALLDLAGAKNAKIIHLGNNPTAWKWQIVWE